MNFNKEGSWENFFEKKFSQPLSKNFDRSLAVRARRVTKALENLITGIVTIMVLNESLSQAVIFNKDSSFSMIELE